MHTPGPWKWVAINGLNQSLITLAPGYAVMGHVHPVPKRNTALVATKNEVVHCFDSSWPTKADKALIAHAPDLLISLQDLVNALEEAHAKSVLLSSTVLKEITAAKEALKAAQSEDEMP